MKNIGYKFVDSSYVSESHVLIMSWAVPRRFRIYYEIGVEVKTKDGSPLLLFAKEQDAREHAPISKLYKCEYVPYHTQEYEEIPNPWFVERNVNLADFWKNKTPRPQGVKWVRPPKGTVYAHSVKLLELMPTPEHNNFREH